MWERFFVSKFKHKSDGHLYLILDGLDEADSAQRENLLELLKKLRTEKSNIHVLLTSSPALEKIIVPLEPNHVKVTKEKISKDMLQVIDTRLKTFSQLRKFRRQTKKKITEKLLEKADSEYL